MKKNSTVAQSPKRAAARKGGPITIGMDLGDKISRYCVLGANGERLSEGSVATTRKAMAQKFSGMRRCRVAMEVGTHSPWLSRGLTGLGFEVIVANARQVQLISASSRKNDRMDAHLLARLARVDPQLLRPIRHRSEQAQADLMTIRIRAALVEARTSLVNAARGFAKAQGDRLPVCDADAMGVEKMEALPAEMRERLRPLLEQVESLTEKIQESDAKIEQIARTQYPETELLRQVSGVGPLIALTFVLTVEDRDRFQKSRDVGCYVGLRPKAERVRPEPAAAADHQGRRPVFAPDAGARGTLYSEPARSGYGFETMGAEAGCPRRQECEEARDRGGGAEAGGVAAPVVGVRRSVRALAQQPGGAAFEAGSLRACSFVL